MEYKTLPSYDSLMETLRKTISNSWHINTIHSPGINQWLSNFSGEALKDEKLSLEEAKELEQKIALFLLCNFIYYNEEEVKHLLRVMLEKFIHIVFTKNNLSNVTEQHIDSLISKTKFSSLGNQSESSSYMLYLFRQINDLSKKDFEDKKGCENIVFVDDFSITGSQAEWYIKKYLKKHPDIKDKNIFVLLMVSTEEAIDKISSIPEVKHVMPCIIMDESSKTFSDTSIVFQGYSPEFKEQAKKLCNYYGELIMTSEEGNTPLGFGGSGYLIGAYYNTPNNSLPIFWSEVNHWKPIFKRYDKKYSADSRVRFGGLYV